MSHGFYKISNLDFFPWMKLLNEINPEGPIGKTKYVA